MIYRNCVPSPVHLTSAIVFQMVFFSGSSMEIPGKAVVPELGACGVLGKELESVPLHFSCLSREPRSPPQARPASEPQGVKETSLSSLWETNHEPLAGGRKSLLTHAQPGLGALLLSEKLILGICTELFIVKAALIPSVQKPLEKN